MKGNYKQNEKTAYLNVHICVHHTSDKYQYTNTFKELIQPINRKKNYLFKKKHFSKKERI